MLGAVTAPTRRRLAPALRREAILEAADPAFAAGSPEAVLVADVAADAGVSEALVFKYFGSKTALQAAVLERRATRLARQRDEADALLAEGTTARDRVAAALLVWFRALAAGTGVPMTAPHDSVEVASVRSAVRADWRAWLQDVLRPRAEARDSFALDGFLGFLDAAGGAWEDAGCPDEATWSLIDASLGALEGALGDWRR